MHQIKELYMAKNYFERYAGKVIEMTYTFDLKQELLSRGPAVEVLSPEAFRLEIKEDIAEMAKQDGL